MDETPDARTLATIRFAGNPTRVPAFGALPAAALDELIARLTAARHAAGLAPRAFARLSRGELRAFAARHGLSPAEAAFGRHLAVFAWAAHRTYRINRLLERNRQRAGLH